MLTKRIIPCLDIKDGRTVKGVKFVSLRDAGDPVELAKRYAEEGADELVFLDISATQQKRKTLVDLVRQVAKVVDIPFTVGGGVSSLGDVSDILSNGADKIAVNSAAVKRPELINELAAAYGSQCIVVAADAKFVDGTWMVFVAGGTHPTEKDLFSWVLECQQRGAGEILFTSMDHDGEKSGFAIDALARISNECSLPLIASGGAGSIHDFVDVFTKGRADGGLAASIFHFGEIGIQELKQELKTQGIPVRI